jgi:hypothetical protein
LLQPNPATPFDILELALSMAGGGGAEAGVVPEITLEYTPTWIVARLRLLRHRRHFPALRADAPSPWQGAFSDDLSHAPCVFYRSLQREEFSRTTLCTKRLQFSSTEATEKK